MKNVRFIIVCFVLILTGNSFSQNDYMKQIHDDGLTWLINRSDSIGGNAATALSQLPTVVSTPYGNAALFNGTNQALLINGNPLGTAKSFTIEVFFRPDSQGTASNEQRFLHIRNLANDNRRVLMEIRLLASQQWLLDTYIKSDTTATPNNLTLVDSTKPHPVGQWHHVAIVYDGTNMHQYVNGVEQLSGAVIYKQIDLAGKTSVGARQDPRSWFKGAIYMVKVTGRVLAPGEFTIPVVTGTRGEIQKPIELKLDQNYPNPFNPSTTINYEVPIAGKVSIKVYSVLGNEVAQLANEYQQAGMHAVQFQGKTLSSGAYFYKLQSGDFVKIRKMVLMK